MMGGPNFETPAELRLMRLQGVDAVGISKIVLKLILKSEILVVTYQKSLLQSQ